MIIRNYLLKNQFKKMTKIKLKTKMKYLKWKSQPIALILTQFIKIRGKRMMTIKSRTSISSS